MSTSDNCSRHPSGPRILVVRLGAMGDIVHTLPAVASLKHSYRGSHLTWAVEPQWSALLEGNPFVDRLLLLNRGNPSAIFESCRELREERFDFAVDFQGLMKSALVASVACADRIFGFHQSQVREKPAALVYSHKTLSASVHVVEKNLDLATAAGAASIVHAFPLPEGHPEGSLPGDFVLACPFAGWRSKQWPLSYYGILAAQVKRDFDIPLVLDGPPGMQSILKDIPHVVSRASGLPGLISAIRRATAVVGVDSGPLHLAAALGKTGVAIFGPTDPARNGPYGNAFTVLRSPDAVTSYKRLAAIDESMQAISPDQVFESLKPLLLRRFQSAGCIS